MQRRAANEILLIVLMLTGVFLVPQRTVNAQQSPQSSLRLRRWHMHREHSGRWLLQVDIGNYGDRSVNIGGIAAGDGAFTIVGQDIQPGRVLNWAMVIDQEPAYITLDTSDGKFRFDLIPNR